MARQYGNGTEAAENAAKIVAEEKASQKATVRKISIILSLVIIGFGIISLLSNIIDAGELTSEGDDFYEKITQRQEELDKITADEETYTVEYKKVEFRTTNPYDIGTKLANLQQEIRAAELEGNNRLVSNLVNDAKKNYVTGYSDVNWYIDNTEGTWYFDTDYWFESAKAGEADRVTPWVVWRYYLDSDVNKNFLVAFAIGRYVPYDNKFDSITLYHTHNFDLLKQYDLNNNPVDKNGDGKITPDEMFYGVETNDYADYEAALDEELRKKKEAEESKVNDDCGDCE